MHEIAEPRSSALTHLILSTTGLSEVSDRWQFGVNRPATEPSIVQVIYGLFCVLFSTEFYVDVANEVIAQVVADVHFLYLSVLVFAFNEDILKEIVVVLLHLFVGHVRHKMWPVCGFGRILRVHVEVLEECGLTKCRFVVYPRTSISMSAGSDFEIKWAVDPVKK